MCGIIGYTGPENCTPILIDGLRRLEYRGYDSAGIALVDGEGEIQVKRAVGKLRNLEKELFNAPIFGQVGIGHTRWATHGRPSEENAHPHRSGDIVVVHNGIIENHLELKEELTGRGRVFQSETDTEIFSHLIDEARTENPEWPLDEAVRYSLRNIRGSYAIAVLDRRFPDTLVTAKNASPMVLGFGEDEAFVASDIPAIIAHTRDVIFLDEGDMAILQNGTAVIKRIETGEVVERSRTRISWTPAMAEKGGYKHFMLKEIHEQPRAFIDTIRGRVSNESNRVFLENVSLDKDIVSGLSRIVIIACGTSWHAGLVGEYVIEELARIPVEVDLASEFRYRDPIVGPDTLVIAISQSGETADTLAALRLAREKGARVLSLCNVVGSSIARESDDVLYTHAGPEIGVASTKAFTTQLACLYLIGIHLGQVSGKVSEEDIAELLQELLLMPQRMENHLSSPPSYRELARKYMHVDNMLFLGRGIEYPIALEGALKLKEISYIHAEGYAAGEMKHGPIALIDENVPSVVLLPDDAQYEKVFSNLAEIRARSGKVIVVATEGDARIEGEVDDVVFIPKCHPLFQPLLVTLPMQLFSYHVADLKGTDVDQPRNLAKSVTVE